MLKDVRNTILKEAEKEGQIAFCKAEEELESEFVKVKTEGQEKIKFAEQEANGIVENEMRERLSWAKLEAKRIIAEAKEDVVSIAFDALIEKLRSYTTTKPYAVQMKAKILSALGEIGENAIVHVKKEDKTLFSALTREIKPDADIIGGAIVESADSRLKIDISLEEFLNAKRDKIRREFYIRLFK